MRLKGLVVALITGSFLAGSGVAWTSKGILVGVARDPTGAVVPNAKGTIVGNSDSATRTNATKSDASYRLEALNPETYTVTVHQPGFDGFTANNLHCGTVVGYNLRHQVRRWRSPRHLWPPMCIVG
jgi:hypothetical protein